MAHRFKDTVAINRIKNKDFPYRRRELYLQFKDQWLMYGWCDGNHLAGIWEPEHPWGFYEETK